MPLSLSSVNGLVRWLVSVTVFLSAVLVWPALDSFHLTKWTTSLLAALVMLAVWGMRLARHDGVDLPWGPFPAAALTFVLGALLVTGLAGSVGRSLFGAHGRWSGALGYAAYVIIAVAVIVVFDRRSVRRLGGVVVGAGVAVAGYAWLQRIGIDPIPWNRIYGEAQAGTLGNPNFMSAYLGIGIPVAAWLTLESRGNTARSVGWALSTIVLASSLPLADSTQGYVAAGAGLWWMALCLICTQHAVSGRRLLTSGWVFLTVMAAGLVTWRLLAGGSPPVTLEIRLQYWGAALTAFVASPVIGPGLGSFSQSYWLHRSADAWNMLGDSVRVDAPHNVPLTLLAEGGLVVALPYMVATAIVGICMIRALRNQDRSSLLAVGGIGGAWIAYQLQSLVSIDVPPLALVGWVLAAATLVVSGADRTRTWRPGKSLPAKRRKRVQGLATGLFSLALLVASVGVFRPIRADIAARNATVATSPEETDALFAKAVSLAPWEERYLTEWARILAGSGRLEAAAAVLTNATTVAPLDWEIWRALAKVSGAIGETDRAIAAYERALELNPASPALGAEVAAFVAEAGTRS